MILPAFYPYECLSALTDIVVQGLLIQRVSGK